MVAPAPPLDPKYCHLQDTAGKPVPLLGVAVTGTLTAGTAHITVRQHYRNQEQAAIEAVYTFALPAEATLSGFAMACGGTRNVAQVQERKAAFAAYDQALTQGHGAALLEQERPDVFTASVGNLLPGEDTFIEIEYLQPLHGEEGALRFALPTVVAPRYMPGTPLGTRTGDGRSEPTDVVPDADRISPLVGDARYTLSVQLTVACGTAVQVESPSHKLVTAVTEQGVTVQLAEAEVLDRDLVLVLRGATAATLAGTVCDAQSGDGTFALTLVPDLNPLGVATAPQTVVFVLDRSGSMGGEAMPQAIAALRLCLRQLRQGDHFQILAFDDRVEPFARHPVAYDQVQLQRADAWLQRVDARGGTELLAPMLQAVQAANGGLVVLLTDGQVGNEDEIAAHVLAKRQGARIVAFGIGTAVSTGLLRELAKRSGGDVAFIYPGERIDDKVTAVFAQATAARVTGVSVKFDLHKADGSVATPTEWAPAELPDAIDGTPWTLCGRYAEPASGTVQLSGQCDGKPWQLTLTVDLPAEASHPTLPRLWATQRIADLAQAKLNGRRDKANHDRIVALAVAHRVNSPFTSFVVVQERTGERLTQTPAQTRFVPVHAPAGWAMCQSPAAQFSTGVQYAAMAMPMPNPMACQSPSPVRSRSSAGAVLPPPPPAPMAMPQTKARAGQLVGKVAKRMAQMWGPADAAPPSWPDAVLPDFEADQVRQAAPGKEVQGLRTDDPSELLQQQLASGLWDDATLLVPVADRQLVATALALTALVDAGITTSHAQYGAQLRKAVAAVQAAVAVPTVDQTVRTCALAAAYLAASGGRTRGALAQVIASHAPTLTAMLADTQQLRAACTRVGQ